MTAHCFKRFSAGLLLAAAAAPAFAWEPAGTHRVTLHARDGTRVDIGAVQMRPAGDGRYTFALMLDHARFKDHFLSMREFKCLEALTEVFCHVAYPYARPDTVSAQDLAWLEHALLFMFKLPSEFGAKLWNGIYFRMQVTPQGIVGMPQAVDLNLIGAPPARTDVPPFKPALRDDIAPGARWFVKLTIG